MKTKLILGHSSFFRPWSLHRSASERRLKTSNSTSVLVANSTSEVQQRKTLAMSCLSNTGINSGGFRIHFLISNLIKRSHLMKLSLRWRKTSVLLRCVILKTRPFELLWHYLWSNLLFICLYITYVVSCLFDRNMGS